MSHRPKLGSDDDLLQPGSVRTLAFRHLLDFGTPLPPATLARTVQVRVMEVLEAVEQLESAGLLRRDEQGDIVGVAGLSVVPSRHELWIGTRKFWTWCAYDALGILAALKADGRVVSCSPQTGTELSVGFKTGVPDQSPVVLFMTATDDCRSVYGEWCPTVNLFEDEATARLWSSKNSMKGQTLSLEDACVLGAGAWAPLVGTEGESAGMA